MNMILIDITRITHKYCSALFIYIFLNYFANFFEQEILLQKKELRRPVRLVDERLQVAANIVILGDKSDEVYPGWCPWTATLHFAVSLNAYAYHKQLYGADSEHVALYASLDHELREASLSSSAGMAWYFNCWC